MTCKLHRLPAFLTQEMTNEQSQGGRVTFRSCADIKCGDRTYNANVLSRKSCRPSEGACNAVVLRAVGSQCDIVVFGP